jgi:predicted O-linked N-acetylglucosamine transferase (SPINDLY family)
MERPPNTPSGPLADRFRQAGWRHRTGDLVGAEPGYRAVLAEAPDHFDALHLLGVLLLQTGRRDEALPLLRRALALQPGRPDVLCNLAEVERQLGNPAAAVAGCLRALEAAPAFPEAHFNLGNALGDLGRSDEAVAAYRRALELRPAYAEAHFNLANLLRAEGQGPVAVRHYREALALRPRWWPALYNLGITHLQMGDTDPALEYLSQALAGAPPGVDVEGPLGDACLKQGRVAEAAGHYQALVRRYPERWLRRLRLEALAEVIPPSTDYVDDYRARLADVLARYRGERLALDAAQLHVSAAEPPVALAYHGRDDRPLKEGYAALFAPLIRPLDLPPPSGPPHVGVVVTHRHEIIYNRCLGALIARLAAGGRLRVSLVSTRAGVNVLRHLRPDFRGEYLTVPERVDEAAAAIAAAGVDVLHFWEVGTDALNYFLPYYRPARVQTATWGWPVTTGTDRVDAFVSSGALEPANGEGHYTEHLVRLPALPAYVERPAAAVVAPGRERFGLPADAHLYLCLQNLRKLQPDFDPVLGDVLRADPAGLLVLIAAEQPALTELLLRRLGGAMPDVIGRVRVVPRLPHEEYLGLVALADVVLDPPHYGAGANTATDAAWAAVPVVTRPGEFHRGRWQAAVNGLLSVHELTAGSAADYVRQAVRAGTDAGFRRELAARIAGASAALFEDAAAVRAHEAFFLWAVEQGRLGRSVRVSLTV